MSWLSAALDRNKLGFVNTLAKPLVKGADAFVRNVIPGGDLTVDIANKVGNYIPKIGGKGGGSTGPTGNPELDAALAKGGAISTGINGETGAWDPSALLALLSKSQGGGGTAPVQGPVKTPTGATPTGNLSAADWLKIVGGGLNSGLNYQTSKDKLAEDKRQFDVTSGQRSKEFDTTTAQRAREFDANAAQRIAEFNRTQGQSEALGAASAQNLINRAPMADQAQYMMRARMSAPPTAFAPRDFTRTGLTQQTMRAPATGGPQEALAASRIAAQGYKPGAGGVDTSVLDMLKKKMIQSSGMGG